LWYQDRRLHWHLHLDSIAKRPEEVKKTPRLAR
jgi:hypothetical protein